MSTKYLWTDVRLIGFDLHTVEFTYAGDYAVSLTCTDELASNKRSYHLRFSRVVPGDAMEVDDMPDSSQNPHEDAELFLCALLSHRTLSTALHRLVTILRETLPIVTELEDIRVAAARSGDCIDTFPKSAGWYRVLYGDLRHALDFRLMTGARVVILDGSHTLFEEGADGRLVRRPATAKPPAPPRDHTSVALQPIPDFRTLVAEAIKAAVAHGVRGQFAPIDIGVICDVSAVRVVGRMLHQQVLRKLTQLRTSSSSSLDT